MFGLCRSKLTGSMLSSVVTEPKRYMYLFFSKRSQDFQHWQFAIPSAPIKQYAT